MPSRPQYSPIIAMLLIRRPRSRTPRSRTPRSLAPRPRYCAPRSLLRDRDPCPESEILAPSSLPRDRDPCSEILAPRFSWSCFLIPSNDNHNFDVTKEIPPMPPKRSHRSEPCRERDRSSLHGFCEMNGKEKRVKCKQQMLISNTLLFLLPSLPVCKLQNSQTQKHRNTMKIRG